MACLLMGDIIHERFYTGLPYSSRRLGEVAKRAPLHGRDGRHFLSSCERPGQTLPTDLAGRIEVLREWKEELCEER